MTPFRCTKQLRVAQSIYDNDAVRLKGIGETSNFLRRSAQLIERQAGSAIAPTRSSKVDEQIRLALTADGPTFVAKNRLYVGHPKRIVARRVGDYDYTRDFAEFLFQSVLLEVEIDTKWSPKQ